MKIDLSQTSTHTHQGIHMTKAFKELQGMNQGDLAGKLQEVKKETIKLKAQVAIGTVPKNSLQIRNHRRTIARILTLLNRQKPPVQKTEQKSTEQKQTEQKQKPKLTTYQLPKKQKGQ